MSKAFCRTREPDVLQDCVWEEQSSLITYIGSSWEIYPWIWADTQRKDVVLESHAPRSGGCLVEGWWMEDTVSGSCPHIMTSCKVIQQLESPRPGSGEEPASVNTAHLQD